MIKVCPSLLAADYLHFGESIDQIIDSGADWLHFDAMDGSFVPNLSFGPKMLEHCATKGIFCDVHLMINHPERHIKRFAESGANLITVHVEACEDIPSVLDSIHASGCMAGIAYNRCTPIDGLESFVSNTDLVLIMLINAGFGGQKLIPECLEKVRQARALINKAGNRQVSLQVDGGVCANTAPLCVEAGADTLVAGTAFFASDNKRAFVQNIRQLG